MKPADLKLKDITSFQEALVLAACPPGARVISAMAVRNYLHPCPFRVRVRVPDHTELDLILKMDRFSGGVDLEAKVLPGLARCGLPVPTILVGPSTDPENPELGPMLILTHLPGENLLKAGRAAMGDEKTRLGDLVLDAVDALHSATSCARQQLGSLDVSTRTLEDELRFAAAEAGEWSDDPDFAAGVAQLQPLVHSVSSPLVLSNADFNPANFLSDGTRVTGIVDFGGTCWEDPLLGVARYATFGWLPYDGELLTDNWSRRRGVHRSEMELRIAVACLVGLKSRPRIVAGKAADRQRRIRQRLRIARTYAG